MTPSRPRRWLVYTASPALALVALVTDATDPTHVGGAMRHVITHQNVTIGIDHTTRAKASEVRVEMERQGFEDLSA